MVDPRHPLHERLAVVAERLRTGGGKDRRHAVVLCGVDVFRSGHQAERDRAMYTMAEAMVATIEEAAQVLCRAETLDTVVELATLRRDMALIHASESQRLQCPAPASGAPQSQPGSPGSAEPDPSAQ